MTWRNLLKRFGAPNWKFGILFGNPKSHPMSEDQYLRIISAIRNCNLGFNIQSFAKIRFWTRPAFRILWIPAGSCFRRSHGLWLGGDESKKNPKTCENLRDSVAKICCCGRILTHDQLFRSFEYLFGKLKSCLTWFVRFKIKFPEGFLDVWWGDYKGFAIPEIQQCMTYVYTLFIDRVYIHHKHINDMK